MEVAAMKKLLTATDPRRLEFNTKYKQSLRYYFNENDITLRNNGESKVEEHGKDELLRSADNRVSNNYHQLLVDQEAGYVATVAPSIDVEDDALNDKIKNTLGDNFNLRLNQLVVDTSNAGKGWLHYWIDEDNQFRYGIVPPDQVTPIYSSDLTRKLIAVRRTYSQLNPEDGKAYNVHEYWTDKDVTVFTSKSGDYRDLHPYTDRFTFYDITTGEKTGTTNVYNHQFGRIPFIGFQKNKFERPELNKYKGLIDVYDNVYNGFVNDIDDVQQVILVLTNYGGESLDEFKKALKKDKAVKFESMGSGDKSGLDKLTIDIPVEARNSVMESTKGDIFVHGQGIDPTKFEANNATGVAIKMLYSHLELKAAQTESYFRDSLSELIRAIMNWMKVADANGRRINQVWTRTAIQNDVEQAQIVSSLSNITSDENIAKGNPLVEDWQEELELRKDDVVKHDGFDNPGAFDDLKPDDDNPNDDEVEE